MDFKISGACLCVYAKYMYIYVCMYVCMHACMYVCMYIRYINIHIHIHMNLYVYHAYIMSVPQNRTNPTEFLPKRHSPRQGPELLPRPKRSSESSPETISAG